MTRVYSLPENKEDIIATVSKAKAKSTKAAPKRGRGKADAQAEELGEAEGESVEEEKNLKKICHQSFALQSLRGVVSRPPASWPEASHLNIQSKHTCNGPCRVL